MRKSVDKNTKINFLHTTGCCRFLFFKSKNLLVKHFIKTAPRIIMSTVRALFNVSENFAAVPASLLHLVLKTLRLRQRRQRLQRDGAVVDRPVKPVPALETVKHWIAQVLLRCRVAYPRPGVLAIAVLHRVVLVVRNDPEHGQVWQHRMWRWRRRCRTSTSAGTAASPAVVTQRKDSDLGVSVVESFSESEHCVLSTLDLEFDELQKYGSL